MATDPNATHPLSFAQLWGLTGYPESFLLDKEGRVAAAIHGPLTQDWIDAHVTPLVNRA